MYTTGKDLSIPYTYLNKQAQNTMRVSKNVIDKYYNLGDGKKEEWVVDPLKNEAWQIVKRPNNDPNNPKIESFLFNAPIKGFGPDGEPILGKLTQAPIEVFTDTKEKELISNYSKKNVFDQGKVPLQ